MKNIITELYYGNIDPQARGFKKDSYLQKQMSILSKCEAELTDKLDGEEKKAFLSFVNASNVILENLSLTALSSALGLVHDLFTILLWTAQRRMRIFFER